MELPFPPNDTTPSTERHSPRLTRRAFCTGLTFAALGFGRSYPQDATTNPLALPPLQARVHINQVGFLPTDPKRAVIAANRSLITTGFSLIEEDAGRTVRHRGELRRDTGPSVGYMPVHYFADFDAFQRPGRYRLCLADGRQSEPFAIGSTIYTPLATQLLDYFDTQICGATPSPAHGPCHRDDGIASGGPQDGKTIDASGGWHDAGDYLKFVETTSFVTAVLLTAYHQYPKAFSPAPQHQKLPPVLASARVGIDWLLKMHPEPDAFYYQVGGENDHDRWRLPEEDTPEHVKDWKPRPVLSGVGANLAGRASVTFALAAQLFKPYDRAYAERCHKAAESAFALGVKNPQIVTTQPADFYPETTWADDMEWAAAHLYALTKREEYRQQALAFSRQAGSGGGVSVYSTHALAHHTLYPHVDETEKRRLLGYLRADAEAIQQQAANPYSLGTHYTWGTAEAAAGAALVCHLYADLSGEKAYRVLAKRQRDFILGCNPFGLCCVIGVGARYPLNPHHQIASLRGRLLSGALIGGPTSYSLLQKEKFAEDSLELSAPTNDPSTVGQVSAYQDILQNYVTNEPANDYTVKMLLLTVCDISVKD